MNFESGIFTTDITEQFSIYVMFDNYFSTDKLFPRQIRNRPINKSTLNNFYHNFSIIDTCQVMVEMKL